MDTAGWRGPGCSVKQYLHLLWQRQQFGKAGNLETGMCWVYAHKTTGHPGCLLSLLEFEPWCIISCFLCNFSLCHMPPVHIHQRHAGQFVFQSIFSFLFHFPQKNTPCFLLSLPWFSFRSFLIFIRAVTPNHWLHIPHSHLEKLTLNILRVLQRPNYSVPFPSRFGNNWVINTRLMWEFIYVI